MTSNIQKSVYQPGKINDRSLIFAYPFLIDKNLEREYGDLLRDFFSIQFINQIKESSIINITTSAVDAGGQYTTSDERINPAEALAKSMGYLQPGSNTDVKFNYANIDKREYQEKIYQFQRFIQNQVYSDPRYADLKPLISSVTVENLLDIPVILGTKSYGIDSNVLFWIIFLATGALNQNMDSIELDNKNALDELKKVMFYANKTNYSGIFGSATDARTKSIPSGGGSGIDPSYYLTPDKFSMGLRRFEYALDSNQWNEQIGINPSNNFSVSVTTTISENPHLRDNVKNKATALFNGIYSTDIIPMIQSIIHIVIREDEVAYNTVISQATREITDISKEIFINVLSSIDTAYVGKNDNQTDQLFAIQEKMCEINSKIAVGSILDKFHSTYLSMSGNNVNFYTFVENLNLSSNMINAYTIQLTDHIGQLGTDKERIIALLNNSKSKISKTYSDLFNSISPDRNRQLASRVNSIIGVTQFDISKFLDNCIESLTNITGFLALYVFFSYNCEYLDQIKAKIQVSRNTAIQFPNYCLVLTAPVVYKIYMAMAIADLKNRRSDPSKQSTLFKINEQHVMNMVRTLSQRLRIPNIIVIDEKTNSIYYRWMFHNPGFFAKIGISNLSGYINSQKDILPSI